MFRYPRVVALALLVKREVFEKVGLFDEDYTPGNYEDDDLCVRALRAGFDTVIAQDVFIHHFGRSTFRGSRMKYYEIVGRSKRLFHKKWGSTPYDDALVKRLREEKIEDLVSIIVPTYNRPESLRRAVASVIDQTYQKFELIVINRGGSDISDELEEFGDRVCIVNHEKYLGLGEARNLGLSRARGKFIAYLDDDSNYYPDHLETLLAALNGTSCTAAYAKCSISMPHNADQSNSQIFQYDEDRLLAINYIPISTVMHELRLLRNVGFFDESADLDERWDFLIRLSQHTFMYPGDKVTSQVQIRPEWVGHGVKWRYESTKKIYKKYASVYASRDIKKARAFLLLLLGALCMVQAVWGDAVMQAFLRLTNRLTQHVMLPFPLRGFELFSPDLVNPT